MDIAQRDNLGKPVQECQTVVDFSAARNDGSSGGDNQNACELPVPPVRSHHQHSVFTGLLVDYDWCVMTLSAQKTNRAWFSCLLWHLARKRSGSIVTTPEPTHGQFL